MSISVYLYSTAHYQTQLQLWLKALTNVRIYFPMKLSTCVRQKWFSAGCSALSPVSETPDLFQGWWGCSIFCALISLWWNSKHTPVHFTEGQNRKKHSVYTNSHLRHFPLSVRTPTSTNYCLQKHGEGELNSMLA